MLFNNFLFTQYTPAFANELLIFFFSLKDIILFLSFNQTEPKSLLSLMLDKHIVKSDFRCK